MRYLYCLLLCFIFNSSNAQYHVVPIETGGTFFLNNPARAGGSSRKVISVDLPENTVKWYYVVSAYRNKSDIDRVKNEFNLVSKLTYLYDQSGITANIVSSLSTPIGTDYCDVYLLASSADVDKFTSLLRKGYKYYDFGSTKHVVSYKQEINDSYCLSGRQYIGVENPTLLYGINVSIQIAAIVKDDNSASNAIVPQKEWTLAAMRLIRDKMKDAYNNSTATNKPSEEVIDGYISCFLGKLVDAYTPEQYSALSTYERNSFIKTSMNECASN